MTTGIVLLNFGEPESATAEAVVPFLERIFAVNMSLEGRLSAEAARARVRRLAEDRAPGLIAEYREIGGSPLNRQARAQAEALAAELERRGRAVRTGVAYQFAEPLIADVVRGLHDEGVEKLIGLPVYPLCGPSTTVAALEAFRGAAAALGIDARLAEVGGWHRHPNFVAMWTDAVLDTYRAGGIDPADPRVRLVFLVHGTPLKYVEEGSRYVEYAAEACAAVAAAAGANGYRVGYQNHTNRPVEWTQPDVEAVIEEIDADHVVVVPISFMHEQSETLAELDHELREEAEAHGLNFHRVPVPHDDTRLAVLLADLVEPLAAGKHDTDADACFPATGASAGASEVGARLRRCRCRPGAVCMGGGDRA